MQYNRGTAHPLYLEHVQDERVLLVREITEMILIFAEEMPVLLQERLTLTVLIVHVRDVPGASKEADSQSDDVGPETLPVGRGRV